MKSFAVVPCGIFWTCLSCCSLLAQPVGLTNRVTNTTLRLPSAPPVFAYTATNTFPGLSWTNPIAIAAPPGETNRLFVLEQAGRIVVITNLAAPTRSIFLNIAPRISGGVPNDERGLLGFAFHPGYATNRFFYIYYSLVTNTAAVGGTNSLHQRLSRWEISATDSNVAAGAATEMPLLTLQDDANNHNGGDLHFGPDGYLYLSLGDEGGGNDQWNNSQLITKDFWSSLLRLDVDLRPGNLEPNPHPGIHPGTYRVPADNPFVGRTTWHGSNVPPDRVRTEFYAVGLRNPWRWSFDRQTAEIYLADVGQTAREEVNLIVRGGNYGWAFREGLIAGPKAAPAGAQHINPILDYGRGTATNQGTSITGGVVYRGSRYPQLIGGYLFADYVSGNVWMLRHNGTTTTNWVHLFNDSGIVGFGVDPRDGDVLTADQNDDQVKRVVFAPTSGGAFPPTLADAGVFTNLAMLQAHSGLVPYEVNLPGWADGATARRWFYVPSARTISFRATNNWTFPTGTVWIQHLEMELTNGVPESARRLETRILVRDSGTGVYGITYRWNDAQDNAVLVPANGLEETLLLHDGGVTRTQVWRYPGRSECLACHTGQSQGGLALGMNTPQMNRDVTYANGVRDNQLRTLRAAGFFNPQLVPTNFNLLRALAHPTNEAASTEQRARSYLAVHCAPCHQPGGASLGNFDTRLFATLPQTRLIRGVLVNNGGDTNNVVVAPGAPERSGLYARQALRGPRQMPPGGTRRLDEVALGLFRAWITNDLPAYQTLAAWQVTRFGATNAPGADPGADPDRDGAVNALEYLVGSDPQAGGDAWEIRIERSGATVEIVYPRVANRGFEVQSTGNPFFVTTWEPLDVPLNQPFFSSTNGMTRVVDAVGDTTRFYRVRVYEP